MTVNQYANRGTNQSCAKTFCIFHIEEVEDIQYKEFFTYYVYEDGRVYSTVTKRFLKGDRNHGYLVYALSINKERWVIKAHRLVAFLFLETPYNHKQLLINHKDGNKLNNHYSNLEWCTHYENNYHARKNNLNNVSKSNSERWKNDEFRQKMSKKFSENAIKNQTFKGRKNGRFRYEIYDKDGHFYERTELAKLLNLSQSYTDILIKKAANGQNNPYFESEGIFVKDTKSKVNRLSKATDNEKDVA